MISIIVIIIFVVYRCVALYVGSASSSKTSFPLKRTCISSSKYVSKFLFFLFSLISFLFRTCSTPPNCLRWASLHSLITQVFKMMFSRLFLSLCFYLFFFFFHFFLHSFIHAWILLCFFSRSFLSLSIFLSRAFFSIFRSSCSFSNVFFLKNF